MNFKLEKHIYSLLFSLILIFSMNFRGYAGYVDYLSKIDNNCCIALDADNEDDKSNYYGSGNSEEENNTSNSFEIFEKINEETDYCFKISETTKLTKDQVFYHLDLYSLLKQSLNTPPPEVI